MAPAAPKKAIPKTSPKTRKTRAQIKANENNNIIRNADENASKTKTALEMPKQQRKKSAEIRDDETTIKIVRKLRKRRKNETAECPAESESENGDENKVSKGRKKKASKSEEISEPNKVDDEAAKENVRTRRGKETTKHDEQENGQKSKRNLQNAKETLKMSDESDSNKIDQKMADKTVPKINNLSCNNNNNYYNNNNNNYMHMEEEDGEFNNSWKNKGQLLEAVCAALEEPPELEPEVGCTHDDLGQFLLNSTIKEMFPFALQLKNTTEIFQRLISAIYELEAVQLDQLLDLYHLAIMMQTYQQWETCHMNYRHELLDAVAELSVELQPKDIEYLGISLCDRFVIGTGMKRKDKVIDMHSSIVLLINNSDVNCQIAMTTLLATFAKVSGLNLPEKETDVIKKSFEMAKLVDWMQLGESGHEADLFVLVRSFSLIMNTQQNRVKHSNWNQELGSEIHTFFMKVLRTVRFSRNYNFFAMMIERYIAFCVVRGATPRANPTIVI
ncbi:hypothetical protein ACLKA7_005842 [Drosophila subpalustris]